MKTETYILVDAVNAGGPTLTLAFPIEDISVLAKALQLKRTYSGTGESYEQATEALHVRLMPAERINAQLVAAKLENGNGGP